MNKNELKTLAENLIETFNLAGNETINLFKKGLKIENIILFYHLLNQLFL